MGKLSNQVFISFLSATFQITLSAIVLQINI